MSERPDEKASKVPKRRERLGTSAFGGDDGILSAVHAVTSKMVRSDSKPSPSARGPRSSNTIPPEASKPSVTCWTNRCALCNGRASPHHSSSACCIICRNYSDIDNVAEMWKAKNILAIHLPQGKSFETILRSEQEKTRALQRKEAELLITAKSRRKKANSLHDPLRNSQELAQGAQDEYNGIIKADPYVSPGSKAAKAEYDTKKAKFGELTRSYEAEKSSFEKAARDRAEVQDALTKQMKLYVYITDKLAGRLLYLAGVQPTDHVGRARLFFSWVAKSLRYNRIAHERMPPDERTPVDTILSESEVCYGFANLFNTMFNSGRDPNGPGCSIYVSGHSKHSDCHAPTDENAHAWNAVPLGEGTWKLVDPTWACGAVYNEVVDEAFDPTWFNKSNDEFLLTHIPENEKYQFRNNGQPGADSAILWKADLVDYPLQSRLYRINEASIKPPQRTIKVPSPARTVFKFKKSCTHYDGWYHCFVIWVGTAPKNGKTVTIDTDDLIFVPPLLDGSGWRVSTKLPEHQNSAILFALLSDSQPAQVRSLDEWKRMDTKRTYATVARWNLKTAE